MTDHDMSLWRMLHDPDDDEVCTGPWLDDAQRIINPVPVTRCVDPRDLWIETPDWLDASLYLAWQLHPEGKRAQPPPSCFIGWVGRDALAKYL